MTTMTKGEMLQDLRVSLVKALEYVRNEKWSCPSGEFNAWKNGGKTPGYDTIDVPYDIDCVQVYWQNTEDVRGAIDIFYDRVIFTTYNGNNFDSHQKIDLTTFLEQGLTEENLFQYDVAYGLGGVSTNELNMLCKIAKLLVAPTEDDAYPVEMTI